MDSFDYQFTKLLDTKKYSKKRVLGIIKNLELKFDDLEHLLKLIEDHKFLKRVSKLKKQYNISWQSNRQKYVLKIDGKYVGIYSTKDQAIQVAKDLLK